MSKEDLETAQKKQKDTKTVNKNNNDKRKVNGDNKKQYEKEKKPQDKKSQDKKRTNDKKDSIAKKPSALEQVHGDDSKVDFGVMSLSQLRELEKSKNKHVRTQEEEEEALPPTKKVKTSEETTDDVEAPAEAPAEAIVEEYTVYQTEDGRYVDQDGNEVNMDEVQTVS